MRDNQINIFLDKGWRHNWESFLESVEKMVKLYEKPLIILFPENAFKYKSTKEQVREGIDNLEQILKHHSNTHVCFSVFVFEDEYSANNTGYVVSSLNEHTNVQSYIKHSKSWFDTLNTSVGFGGFNKELQLCSH